jgi:DNA topoisomerase I
MFKIKNGKSTYYVDEKKRYIKNKKDLERIENMRIPPAWNKVIISKHPNAKVQAIGIDEKGRSQFIYSQEHKDKSKGEKYKRVHELGKNLSKITRKIRSELKEPGFEKKKAIALIVMLIMLTSLRIGNKLNKKLYNSYGITTLLKKHLKFQPDKVSLKFIGKKGVENYAVIKDKLVRNLLKQWANKFKSKAQESFFKYIGRNGNIYSLDANDVNTYIKSFGPYTAKDFRTFNANKHLLKELDKMSLVSDKESIKKTHIKKNMVQAMKKVAEHLNNTPAVCKKEYCSPYIVNYYMEEPVGLKKKIAGIRSEKNCGSGDKYERAATYFLK